MTYFVACVVCFVHHDSCLLDCPKTEILEDGLGRLAGVAPGRNDMLRSCPNIMFCLFSVNNCTIRSSPSSSSVVIRILYYWSPITNHRAMLETRVLGEQWVFALECVVPASPFRGTPTLANSVPRLKIHSKSSFCDRVLSSIFSCQFAPLTDAAWWSFRRNLRFVLPLLLTCLNLACLTD